MFKPVFTIAAAVALTACGTPPGGSSSSESSSSSVASSVSSAMSSSSSSSVASAGLCDGDNNYVCLDFESGNPENMIFGSSAQVVSGNAKNGNGSLRFFTNNKNDGNATWYSGFIQTNFSVPGTHWGRMYYRIDSIASPAQYTHITFMAAAAPSTDVRLVDTVRGPSGTHQYLYNFPDDQGGKASSYNWSFDNKWVCVEWHVDSAKQTYEFYREGSMVSEISGNVANDHGGIPANYGKLMFGAQVYQNGPDVSGWLDDIIVGPNRSPCP